jgi:hypothetical protein
MNTDEFNRLLELLNIGAVSKRWAMDMFGFWEEIDEERMIVIEIEEYENV